MFNAYRPTTIEDFESLKKGDLIVVRWDDYFVRHHKGAQPIMAYKIHELKQRSHEVICQLKDNHYFNYHLYLGLDENKSSALEVLFVRDGEEND